MRELYRLKDLPLVNNLLDNKNDTYKLYPLIIGFDDETNLVGLINNAPSEEMFNSTYVYDSSQSKTMVEHFRLLAKRLYELYKPQSVLEIGANSGIFIENFTKDASLAVEPCSNFANRLKDKGINVVCDYWTENLAKDIKNKFGSYDLVYSANTISHIQDLESCFKGIKTVLNDNGVFVMESPSLDQVVANNAIDQFYHEHQSYFSVLSVYKLVAKYGLKLFDVKKTNVHGGSSCYYITHTESNIHIESDYLNVCIDKEIELGINNFNELQKAFSLMVDNLNDIKTFITDKKRSGDKIICYGATAKLCLILNLMGLTDKEIDYVVDTTPLKHNKFIPGTNIKIVPYSKKAMENVDYCLLGAWNFRKEIVEKERDWLLSGGTFLTHIPVFNIITKTQYNY